MRQRSERALLAEFPVPHDDDDDDDGDDSDEVDAGVQKEPPPPAKSGAKRARATARRSAPDRIARGREKARVEPEPARVAGNAERDGDSGTPNGSFEGNGSRRESPLHEADAATRRDAPNVVVGSNRERHVKKTSSFGRLFSSRTEPSAGAGATDPSACAGARISAPAAEPRSDPTPSSLWSSKRRRIATSARDVGAYVSTVSTFSRMLAAGCSPSALVGDKKQKKKNPSVGVGGTDKSVCIAEEDRLPPLRPKARMGGPRGRQLWEKVRLNKNLLIGEGVGTHGASGYWRLRAGVGAFFFSVDMDVNGRKKNRGLALRKAAKATSKRTRFPEDESFLTELESLRDLSRAETHALCKERGLRTRDGPDRSLIDPDVLKARLLHHAHARHGIDWFEPSPFGRNKRGYYAPLVLAVAQCALVSGVTLGATYATYAFAEQWHASRNCHKIWNWMNPQCQAADFLRTHAKQAVYRWYYQVGSVIALRAGAWVDAVSREAGRLAAEATEGLASAMDVDTSGGAAARRDGNASRRR